MIRHHDFAYVPDDQEAERASNSYLMSLIALMAGLPLPIVNLVATGIFYLGNRKAPYFVRWHCTQALVSQAVVLPLNSAGFWWTISILFKDAALSNEYLAYMIVIVLMNLTEFIATIYTAVAVRKRRHVEWWVFGDLIHALIRPR